MVPGSPHLLPISPKCTLRGESRVGSSTSSRTGGQDPTMVPPPAPTSPVSVGWLGQGTRGQLSIDSGV